VTKEKLERLEVRIQKSGHKYIGMLMGGTIRMEKALLYGGKSEQRCNMSAYGRTEKNGEIFFNRQKEWM
jgi:hypothetical protein